MYARTPRWTASRGMRFAHTLPLLFIDGWTYDLDGLWEFAVHRYRRRRRISPRFSRLWPVANRGVAQHLCSNLDPDAEPLRQCLSRPDAALPKCSCAGMKLFERRTYKWSATGKRYWINYLAGYHLPTYIRGESRIGL